MHRHRRLSREPTFAAVALEFPPAGCVSAFGRARSCHDTDTSSVSQGSIRVWPARFSPATQSLDRNDERANANGKRRMGRLIPFAVFQVFAVLSFRSND
jgi:hypothetical protein